MESNEAFFTQAKPIWLKGRKDEMNVWAGFRSLLSYEKVQESMFLKITASCIYRCAVNGTFVGHGPAVAPHGYFRVDVWDLGPYLKQGPNVVSIEVAGYNVNSFYTLDQPSFLQAEIIGAQGVMAATGSKFNGFEAMELRHHVQRVERYSFQRAFVEAYQLGPGWDDWKTYAATAFIPETVELLSERKLLRRGVGYPDFTVCEPGCVVSQGRMEQIVPDQFITDRATHQVGALFKGFTLDLLEREHWKELQLWTRVADNTADSATDSTTANLNERTADKPIVRTMNEYAILDFDLNRTGFIGLTLSCETPSRVYFTFDEILVNSDVQHNRLKCLNMLHFELAPGTYRFESLEPYTLRYFKMIVLSGKCTLTNPYIREYAGKVSPLASFDSSDARLNRVFQAGMETYRQNAVDNFTDCPSRERAGWLCDSFFASRVSLDLTDNTDVEDNFMENYLLPERFAHLPEGMLPMCYPADFSNGQFIPNWSLWFVLQLEEYAVRSSKKDIVSAMLPKVEKLFRYFEAFRNEDGLLEKLESWVFVEWSKANQLVQDVNYPSNMLYAGALAAAGRLYGRKDWQRQAEQIRDTVRQQSYDGEFFRDCAVRENGSLYVRPERTEVCQYYAFFFGTASPKSHPQLWQTLVQQFGPKRKKTEAYPDVYPGVYPANAFIGNYLRLELLSRQGLVQQIVGETADFFDYMAELTGTLWEHDDVVASCNHGFASHVVHLIYRDVLGIREVDRVNKVIKVRKPQLHLEHCSGQLPIDGGVLRVSRIKTDDAVDYRVEAPDGYKILEEWGAS